ncbi:beta strand repeat-containing protein, partial [Marinomonas transparens]
NQGRMQGNGITLTADQLTNSTTNGKIYSTKTLDATIAGVMDDAITNQNGALIHADDALTLTSNNSDTVNAQARIESVTSATLISQNLTNSGTILAQDGELTIDTTVLDKQGALDNQGALVGNGMVIRATELNNSTVNGQLYSTDNIDLTILGNISNRNGALVHADTQVVIDADGNLINTLATIEAVNSTKIDAQNVTNSGTILAQHGELTLGTEDRSINTIENQGALVGNGITLTADQLDNSTVNGQIYSADTLDVTIDGAVANTDGALLFSENALTLTSNNDITNTASTIKSLTSAALMSQNLTNTGTVLAQNAALTIETTKLDNQGGLAGHGITLIADQLDNRTVNGKFYSTDTLDVTIDGAITNTEGALLHSEKALTLTSNNGDLTNTDSTIESVTTSEIEANNVTNSGKLFAQEGVLTVETAQLDNQGTIQGHGLTLTASELENSTANGTLYSTDTLDMTVAGNVTNQDNALIHADKALTLTSTNGDLINHNATIESLTKATLTSQNLTNSGTLLAQGDLLTIRAQQIDNERLLGGTNIDINASVLNNHASTSQIYANNNLDLKTTGAITNSNEALIHAGNELTLTATGDLINSNATIESGTHATLTSHTLNNSAGSKVLTQNGTLTLNMGTLDSEGNLTVTGALSNDGSLTGKDIVVNATTVNNTKSTSRIAATGGLTLNATQGDVNNQNGAKLSANNTLTINAAGDVNNTDSLIESVNNIDITSQNLTNNSTGVISAQDGTLTINTGSLNNQGGLAGNDLTITASGINNTGGNGLILAKDYLNVHSTGAINNLDGGVFFSLGDAYLKANGTLTNSSATIETSHDLTLDAGLLINKRSSVDWGYTRSEKDISGYSYVFPEYNTLGISKFAYTYNRDREGEADRGWTNEKVGQGWYKSYISNGKDIKITPYLTSASAQGYLLSGNDLTLTGRVDNYYSTISAVGNLAFNASLVNNISLAANETHQIKWVETYYTATCADEWWWKCSSGISLNTLEGYYQWPYSENINRTTSTSVNLLNATFTANGSITGKAGSVNNVGSADAVAGVSIQDAHNASVNSSNETIEGVAVGSGTIGQPKGLDGSTPVALAQIDQEVIESRRNAIFDDVFNDLVGDALFKASNTPDANYLVESNPLLTNYKSFISSDYLLNKLTSDSAGRDGKAAVRLGDGFLEQRLVREQILSFTGKQTIPDSINMEDTYARLMENAVGSYEDLQLTLGVGLSAAQIAQLQQPIVWMVMKTVDTPDGPQQALVPKVYFSAASGLDIRPDGALMAANSINIDADDAINNSGSMLATVDLSLKGGRIDNSGTLQSNTVSLESVGDITNSGNLSADQSLSLTARSISNVGSIASSGSASLTASQDITNTRTINATGNLNLVAGGSITNETVSSKRQVGTGGYSRTETTVGDTASIQGGNVSLSAGSNIRLIGSEVKATGDLTLTAANDVSIEAIDINESWSRGYGDSSVEESSTRHQVSSLSGNNIQLNAVDTITSEGANIKAQDNLAISANTIDLLAVQNTTNKQSQSNAWRGGNQSSSTVIQQVSALSGNNIQLSAVNTLTSKGAQINAKGNLALSANNIDLLAVTDSQDSYSFVGGGGNSTEKRDHTETLTGTTLNAGGALTLVSQQDIFSEGSALSGGEGIGLAAGGDVLLVSAVANNSSFEEVKTKKKSTFG